MIKEEEHSNEQEEEENIELKQIPDSPLLPDSGNYPMTPVGLK